MTDTYHGLPLLKEPTWTWEVPTYFFVGGAAGASSVIATMAGDSDLRRHARWVAAVGGAASGALLTADLGRPERFLNMLRVFKLQSPMSVGAWTLAAFSSASAATAFADLIDRQTAGRLPLAVVGDAAGALAAATGLVMTTYTGVLIGATAIPVWNEHVRLLPIHFAASGLASAVALLELTGHDEPALNTLGIAAAAVETLAGAAIENGRGEAASPLKEGASGWITRAGGVLSGPVSLALRLAAPHVRGARRAATVAAFAGAALTRLGWWRAGTASAADPRIPLGLPAVQSSRVEAADGRRSDVDAGPHLLGDHQQVLADHRQQWRRRAVAG
jgi:polysulfide reductase-like protein